VFAPVPLPGCELEALLPQRERHLRYSTSEGAIVSRSRLPQYSRVEASNDCSLMPTSWYPLPAAHQRTGFAKPQSPAYGRVLIAPGTRWSTAMSPPRPLEPEGRRQWAQPMGRSVTPSSVPTYSAASPSRLAVTGRPHTTPEPHPLRASLSVNRLRLMEDIRGSDSPAKFPFEDGLGAQPFTAAAR